MSKAYSINYDLKAPGGNYSGLYEVIKKFGIWWHYMESTWLISTDETAQGVWERISPHIDQNDNVLIVEVPRNYSGWLPQKAWDWINQNVPL